jgi:hypothetical protein
MDTAINKVEQAIELIKASKKIFDTMSQSEQDLFLQEAEKLEKEGQV